VPETRGNKRELVCNKTGSSTCLDSNWVPFLRVPQCAILFLSGANSCINNQLMIELDFIFLQEHDRGLLLAPTRAHPNIYRTLSFRPRRTPPPSVSGVVLSPRGSPTSSLQNRAAPSHRLLREGRQQYH